MKSTAHQMVEYYLEAEKAVLEGRSITFNGRSVTMADLSDIREGREYWERRAASEDSQGRAQPGFVRFL